MNDDARRIDDERFEALKGSLDKGLSFITEKIQITHTASETRLKRIENQVTLTNGRVNELEDKENQRIGEKRIVKWLVVPLVLMVIAFLGSQIWRNVEMTNDLDRLVEEAVAQEIKDLGIEIIE